MDMSHWPQEIVVKPMEEIVVVPNTTNSSNNIINPSKPSSSFERKVRPQKAVNCPRCDSTNTKFCYYNNYSLSQPRYFCKTCRRYWTEGGTLRNIPVGGGSRKNKRSSSSSSTSTSSSSLLSHSKKLHDLLVPPASTSVLSQNPRIHNHGQYYGQDLNLGFPSTNSFKNVTTMNSLMPIPIPMPDSDSVYSAASGELMIPMPEFKIPSSLSFSLDGVGMASGYGNSIQESNSGGRVLFPFEELKRNTSTSLTHEDPDHVGQTRDDQNGGGDSNGFWNGMLGGGSW